ncbi:extracellular solute-binding protein [Curtobacterium flaccumfaciens]|nr:extracellular solute-binding protein [Curtobacterium flaccumfaciens]
MLLTSSGAYTTVDPDGSKSVVARFPTTSDSDDAGQVIGGNALWISGKGHSTAEQKASYTFAKWLQSPDVQAEWAKATGYVAMNTDSATTTVGKRSLSDPNIATMYQQLNDDPTSVAAAGCITGAFPDGPCHRHRSLQPHRRGCRRRVDDAGRRTAGRQADRVLQRGRRQVSTVGA